MKLQSCRKCGCVVDYDNMTKVNDYSELKDGQIGHYQDNDYSEGFECPACKQVNQEWMD